MDLLFFPLYRVNFTLEWNNMRAPIIFSHCTDQKFIIFIAISEKI